MAKKKVAAMVKIQIPAGQASPAPPVGTALGPHGVQIMDFCKAYNAQTEDQRGSIIPVEITIFEDRSFTFITKTPPTSVLIREAARRPRHQFIDLHLPIGITIPYRLLPLKVPPNDLVNRDTIVDALLHMRDRRLLIRAGELYKRLDVLRHRRP